MFRSEISRMAFGFSIVAVAALYVVSLGPAAGTSPAALGAGTAGEAALPQTSGFAGSAQPCTTSADCGGISCDPFISCC